MIVGDADGLAIATGERFGLVLSASSIHRADGVNDIFGGQSSAGGDDSFAGGECADLILATMRLHSWRIEGPPAR